MRRRFFLLVCSSSLGLFFSLLTAFGNFGCGGLGGGGGTPSGIGGATSGGPVPIPTSGSGADAPPISLPAPVTGRLVITSPDGSGAALVIGDTQAATPGSLVMAVNDTQAPAAFHFPNPFRFLVSSAIAQGTLPDVCTQAFHGCGFADGTGAFEFPLQGEADDQVTICLIDPTVGTCISPEIVLAISKNIRALPRRVTDVGHGSPLSVDKLYSLMPATNADPNGLVEVFNLNQGTSELILFDGPRPDRIQIHGGTNRAAIVDSQAQEVSLVDLEAQNFNAPSQLGVPGAVDVTFSDAGDVLLVSTTDPQQPMHLIDPVKVAEIQPISSDELRTHLGGQRGDVVSNITTRAVDHLFMPNQQGTPIDLYAFVGLYDNETAGETIPALGFVGKSDLGGYQIITMTVLPLGSDPTDVAFQPSSSGGAASLYVADRGNDRVIQFDITVDWPATGAGPGVAIAPEVFVADPSSLIQNPLRIVFNAALKAAYVIEEDGDATHPDSVVTIDFSGKTTVKRNDVGLGPTGLTWHETLNKLFVSTSHTHAITTVEQADLH